MQNFLLGFIVLLIAFWLTNCNSPEAKTNATVLEINKITFEKSQEAKIVGSEEILWQSTFSNGGRDEFLEYLQVFNEKSAYVLGEHENLYKTADGGKTWESEKIDIPKDAFISSISFFDFSHGLVSVIKSPDDVLDVDNFHSWILATNDGGNTWHKQFEMKAAEIRKVTFDKEKIAWAIGHKIVKEEHIENQPLVLKNDENGWQEVASPEVLGSIENIYIQEDLTKILIDTEGQIFELNSDMEWKAVNDIENTKPQQIAVSTIGIAKDKKMYLMGATGGREGIWTSLFSKDIYSERWQHYTLKNVILRDALFFSSNEILACGSINQFNDLDRSGTKQGVILHSFDGGSSWVLSFRTAKIESFNKLWGRNGENILAIGEKGNILHLKKSP